ncbi:mediator of RNA polymerase II transcription subunit 15a-like isoform X2 [Rhododendron vialii]|uniref:mediator of RNA polymerase II transcription subunit 15a-like isoform X2 n=1 Tax=Rhododendron vialii TaxID=182163 RepID=UPI00265EFABC|nr:mediator of RNA polymerase II transcription subunit 15a-like isoform X2 [Rhododendron vialii]
MVNKNTNSENSSIPQNAEGNRGGRVLSSKNTVSSRKQQQVQDAEQYEYKQQNQLLKPNCNPRNIPHSVIKTEILFQEQQPICLSQRQQPVMQPSSVLQSAPSSAFHQNPQQNPIYDKKGKQKLQQPILSLQQQFSNATNSRDENNSRSNVYLLGHQNNASSLSSQFRNSSMYNTEKTIYRGPQAEVMVQQQLQRMEANSLPHNQQLLYQMQAQQANLQSQPNPLQQGKSVQPSGSLLLPQHLFEQQKQASESQMAIGCTSQISHTNGDDWKEELYQKIQTYKDLYVPDLNVMYRKISSIIQEMDSIPQHPRMAEYEKCKALGTACKTAHNLLHLPKSQMSPSVERSLHDFEEFVNKVLRRYFKPKRSISSLQQERPPPHDVRSVQRLRPQFQNPEVQLNGNQTNPLLQSMSSHPSVTEMEKKKAKSIIQDSKVSSQGPIQQLGNNFDAERGNVVSLSLQNPGNTSSSRSVGNVPQRIISHFDLSSNTSQNMCVLQQNEQQMIKSRLAKRQPQIRQMTKQSVQQTEAHQIRQLHLNDVNNMKVRQGIGFKEGSFLQNHSTGKLSVSNPHILRSGPPSPQVIEASSPQVSQFYSPQFDQKILHTPFANSGSRLNSPNSRSVGPSPSTSIGPFLTKGDPIKLTSVVSSLASSGDVEFKESSSKLPLHTSYVISTPGLSPSYLLGESDGLDGNQNQVSTTNFCESRLTEEPIQRLVKAVRSLSYKSLRASISDMESVVRLVDSAAASKPGNGSRSAIGEDLAGVAIQGEKLDWNSRKMKMRRHIGAVQSNICASSSKTDSFKQLTDPEKCEDSTATSYNKRPRGEVKCTLVQEIREINRRLVDTVVDISEEEVNSTCGTSASEGSEGTIVRCSFNAVTINPDMTSEHASAIMSLLSPLLLFIPRNYPDCSPILLDKLPAKVSAGCEDLLGKAKSKLCVIMRNVLQPMSVEEIAKSWDVCARDVITDYAQQNGGGNFSSTYGTWEKHLSSTYGTWEKHFNMPI